VATETNKPSIVLRSVKAGSSAEQKSILKQEPVAQQSDVSKSGIVFEGVTERKCPRCNAVVPLSGVPPLSMVLCPSCGSRVLAPGRVGSFLLYDHIGEGEMGTVYRAQDESLGRDVAVKLVRRSQIDAPGALDQLRREACAAGRLNHPHVAQVHALNLSNGYPYLVMELVTGEDFAHKLEREQRIDERTALKMAIHICDGLTALNREGLAHGDIKPGNIVLDRDGNAKLVDFGLTGMARHKDGSLVGTPNYIAPELIQGKPDSHSSDIYSLGATLYHLLTGRPPIDGEKTIDVLRARLFRRPAALTSHARYISEPTRKLIMEMLDPDPARRPPNSEVIAARFREALARLDAPPCAIGQQVSVQDPLPGHAGLPLPPPVTLHSRSRPLVVLVLSLVAALEIAVAVHERSFEWFADTIRQAWARRAQRMEEAEASRLAEEAAVPHSPDDFGQSAVVMAAAARSATQTVSETAEKVFHMLGSGHAWQSVNLGMDTSRGSTMLVSGGLIVQGAGSDMWQGYDRCRYVRTTVSSNYVLSAQVRSVADNNDLAITGMLIKGVDAPDAPSLLYGFLGSKHLFLQIREPNHKTVLVKRSERPIRIPQHLKLVRHGNIFEASFSPDGVSWTPFGACELELPEKNTVGFAASAHDANALATANFAAIRLDVSGGRTVR